MIFFWSILTQADEETNVFAKLEKKVGEHGTAFNQMMQACEQTRRNAEIKLPGLTVPAVSTMTFSGRVSRPLEPSELSALMAAMPFGGFWAQCEAMEQKPNRRSRQCRKTAVANGVCADHAGHTGTVKRGFLNQTTIKFDNVSIKLFTNGSVQVTGLKSVMHFIDVMTRLAAFFHDFVLEEFNICLINASMTVRASVGLRNIKEVFEAQGYTVRYEPENHASLRVRDPLMPGTVILFASGNCNLFGNKTPEHLTASYRRVVEALERLVSGGSMGTRAPAKQRKRNTTTPTPFRIIDGYDGREYMLTTALQEPKTPPFVIDGGGYYAGPYF